MSNVVETFTYPEADGKRLVAEVLDNGFVRIESNGAGLSATVLEQLAARVREAEKR